VARRRWAEADLEIKIALRKGAGGDLLNRLAGAQAVMPEHF
jgi:hypothetical protein